MFRCSQEVDHRSSQEMGLLRDRGNRSWDITGLRDCLDLSPLSRQDSMETAVRLREVSTEVGAETMSADGNYGSVKVARRGYLDILNCFFVGL